METCQVILKSGTNKGQPCGKDAIDFQNNLWCCRRHCHFTLRPTNNQIEIYNFNNILLSSNIPELPACEHFDNLNNYLNFKLKGVIFDEDLPLVFMHNELTPINLFKYIVETIQFLESRPDEYTLNGRLEDFILEKLTYHTIEGMYYIFIRHS
jgi:hypothetical protein